MADRLSEYRAKRDFSRTPEPQGGAPTGGRAYSMQKHDARRLHYDLRLEHDGALLSWAVTRGPSLKPGEKRLAVRTEDHPLDYLRFEGVIPEGYGKGTVMLWDEGGWEPLDDPDKALAKGRLRFRLSGARLRGEWTLARMKGKEKRENWLLMKRRDAAATDAEPTELYAESVATGRTLDEIAAEAPTVEGGAEPAFVAPQLATLVERAPSGAGWLHEIKHDGYRVIAVVKSGRARLFTRSGLDWTDRFDGLSAAFEALGPRNAVYDVEVVAAAEAGGSDFSALQAALKSGGALTAWAFDLLHLEGEDLTPRPLSERRARLRAVLGEGGGPIRLSDDVPGDGAAVLEAACRLGAEGVVSKRADAAYSSGRGRLWVKAKCDNRAEAVIGGFRRSDKPGRPFASLLVGTFEQGVLIYRGRVGAGFDAAAFAALAAALKPLVRETPPFETLPAEARRDAVWVRPERVAELRYAEITADGAFRHARFLGLREDKAAAEVAMDAPLHDAAEPAAPAAAPKVSNPDKVLYPDAGLTKADLAAYLHAIAPRMLPYLAGRPLTLVRCPNGRDQCFFQKHPGKGAPKAIRAWRKRGDAEPYMTVEDEAGLAAAAQLGALELHVGGARIAEPTRPERLVFDLDPGEDVGFEAVRAAAAEVGDLLRTLGLEPFPLLTGGKGAHVVVPLAPRAEWEEAKAFARAFAYALARAAPDRYLAKMTKARRRGLIFLDWLRNGQGATAIAPFSPRARAGAPVATPLDWRALARAKGGDDWTVRTLPARLKRLTRDPWKDYEAARRPLEPGLREALRRAV
jgi:bifunctional non-homologous end joining protein LigD